MTNSTPLVKTCQICGSLKPLSAFLQFSDENEPKYSNICSSCRKNTQNQEASDESTTRKAEHRIGHEQKIAGEIDKRENSKQKEENYYKERDLEQIEQSVNLNKTDAKIKNEVKHRETYLDKSKQPVNKIPSGNRFVFGGIEQTEKEAKFDLTAPFIDTAIPKEKQRSVLVKRLVALFGPNAAIVKAAQKDLGQNKNNPASSSEYIEKKWVPPQKRGK